LLFSQRRENLVARAAFGCLVVCGSLSFLLFCPDHPPPCLVTSKIDDFSDFLEANKSALI
jgi:hypothetical protein